MYRRLSWSQGAVRLRVILGESGTHADQIAQQAIVWMFVIRFLCWQIPATGVSLIPAESKCQYELTFVLPRLAKFIVDMMDVGRRSWSWPIIGRFSRGLAFNPVMTVLRDPDFCASNRPNHHYSLKLFGGGDATEYMEPFAQEDPAPQEPESEEAEEQPATPTHLPKAPHPGWTPWVVADNAPVPYREPQEVDEVPLWVKGVADTKTLFEGEEATEPGERLQDLRPHPRPLRSS